MSRRWEKVGAGRKPGSVEDSHSSGTSVTGRLEQPTRVRCGPHHTPLFGLAPDGVYPATNCYQSRGALLPHHFTLTCTRRTGPSAVYFLRHFPSARAAQALPGVLPCGARTFLHIRGCSDCLADSRAPCTPPRPRTQGFSMACPATRLCSPRSPRRDEEGQKRANHGEHRGHGERHCRGLSVGQLAYSARAAGPDRYYVPLHSTPPCLPPWTPRTALRVLRALCGANALALLRPFVGFVVTKRF